MLITQKNEWKKEILFENCENELSPSSNLENQDLCSKFQKINRGCLYYPQTFKEIDNGKLYDSYAKQLQELAPLRRKMVFKRKVPRSHSKWILSKLEEPTIIFDLDETLVFTAKIDTKDYSDLIAQGHPKSHFFKKVNEDRTKSYFLVTVRPGASGLLSALSEHYTIIIFTASELNYA